LKIIKWNDERLYLAKAIGYALALYAYFRKDSVSDWIKYLTLNIRSDFKKSMDFINANKDRIFMEPYIKK